MQNLARIYMKRKLIGVNEQGRVVGESHHRAKIDDEGVRQIHELAAAGLSQRAIAEKFDDIEGGLSRSTVRDVLRGRIRAQTPSAYKPSRRG